MNVPKFANLLVLVKDLTLATDKDQVNNHLVDPPCLHPRRFAAGQQRLAQQQQQQHLRCGQQLADEGQGN